MGGGLTTLKSAAGLVVGIARIGRHSQSLLAHNPANAIEPGPDRFVFAHLSAPFVRAMPRTTPTGLPAVLCRLQQGSNCRLPAVVVMRESASVGPTILLAEFCRVLFSVSISSLLRFSAITLSARHSTGFLLFT